MSNGSFIKMKPAKVLEMCKIAYENLEKYEKSFNNYFKTTLRAKRRENFNKKRNEARKTWWGRIWNSEPTDEEFARYYPDTMLDDIRYRIERNKSLDYMCEVSDVWALAEHAEPDEDVMISADNLATLRMWQKEREYQYI